MRGHSSAGLALVLAACLACGGAAAADGQAAGALAIQEPGLHFFSGEQVAKTVAFAPAAGEAPADARLSWQLTIGSAVVQRASAEVKAGKDGLVREVILTMPEVRRIAQGAIGLSLQQDADVLVAGRYDIAVFPLMPVVPTMVKGRKVVLYDPMGGTGAALGYLGVKYSELPQTWSLATGEADLLIIGNGVPSDSLARLLSQLRGNVAEGMAVLCLEQVQLDESQLPCLSLANGEGRLSVWAEPVGKEPIRGELAQPVLSVWREDGRIVRRPFLGPARGNFRILLDVVEAADGPPQAAVVEVPFGNGRLIFSQMLIGESFWQEPVARYALVNLLTHALMPHAGVGARAGVLAAPDEKRFRDSLSLLGLDAALSTAPGELRDVAIVSGSEESAEQLKGAGRSAQEELLALLKRGGTVLLAGLKPGAVGAFEFLWDGTLTVKAAKKGAAPDFSTIRGVGLFQGLRPGELSRLCGRASHPAITFVGNGPKGQTVSGDGLLILPEEAGQVIVCQLPLPLDEKDEEALRTYSQLLTGLGVELRIPERREVR